MAGAITYHQQPSASSIQASDNPIIFVFSGANYLQPNFSFVVETKINAIVVSTDIVFPERADRAHFDISQITLALIKAGVRQSSSLYQLEDLSTAQIRVAERYGTIPSTQAFTDSNILKLMKARCDDDTFEVDWITINYPASNKWLTDVPDVTYLASRKNSSWFSILNSEANIVVNVYFYDQNDNQIAQSLGLAELQKDRVNICINPAILNALLPPPLTVDDVYKVKITMNGKPIYVKFVDDDCEFKHQISWLNKLGAYDQQIFSHNRESANNSQSQEYKKQFGNWSDDGLTFNHDPLSSGDTPYVKETTPTGSLYTGWISQDYQNWLGEILQSVDVQLETEEVTERIVVTDTKAEARQTKHEEIINFQLNYRKTNFKSITQ